MKIITLTFLLFTEFLACRGMRDMDIFLDFPIVVLVSLLPVIPMLFVVMSYNLNASDGTYRFWLIAAFAFPMLYSVLSEARGKYVARTKAYLEDRKRREEERQIRERQRKVRELQSEIRAFTEAYSLDVGPFLEVLQSQGEGTSESPRLYDRQQWFVKNRLFSQNDRLNREAAEYGIPERASCHRR